MDRIRVLLLGPDCHPERVSIPRVTYRHAAALAELHDVTLVLRSGVEDDVRRAGAPFRAIEPVKAPRLDKFFNWGFRRLFKSDPTSQGLAAFRYPFSLAFEWQAWQQLRHRIMAGEFDVVLRLLPMSPHLPSPFAFFLRKGPIPFVLGPLNGGLPWPQGFSQTQKQRRWIAGLRNLYRYAPFARSTYRRAAAIIVASSQTYTEFAQYSDKLFFVPEPGISSGTVVDGAPRPAPGEKLELLFVGGLVPIKACDLALRGAAPLLRNGLANFTILGDGPEQAHLEQLAKSLGIDKAVHFGGWLSHAEVLERMRSADVFLFPSIRDNGGGVVFEALASGAVPIVADFGGPGDIVHPAIGYKVPLTSENDVILNIERILAGIMADRSQLTRLRERGTSYARQYLTWEAKARATTQVLRWAVSGGARPDFPLPQRVLPVAERG